MVQIWSSVGPKMAKPQRKRMKLDFTDGASNVHCGRAGGCRYSEQSLADIPWDFILDRVEAGEDLLVRFDGSGAPSSRRSLMRC